ncbi:Uncharacterized protein PBTT_08042 [Plasmodiophora brassicae]
MASWASLMIVCLVVTRVHAGQPGDGGPFPNVHRWTTEQMARRSLSWPMRLFEQNIDVSNVYGFWTWFTNRPTLRSQMTTSGRLCDILIVRRQGHSAERPHRPPIHEVVACAMEEIPPELELPDHCRRELESWMTLFVQGGASYYVAHLGDLYRHHRAWLLISHHDRERRNAHVPARIATNLPSSCTSSTIDNASASRPPDIPTPVDSTKRAMHVSVRASPSSSSRGRLPTGGTGDRVPHASKNTTPGRPYRESNPATPIANPKRPPAWTLLLGIGTLFAATRAMAYQRSTSQATVAVARTRNSLLGSRLARGVLATSLAIAATLRLSIPKRPFEGRDVPGPDSRRSGHRRVPWWVWIVITVTVIASSAGLLLVARFCRRHSRARQYAVWQMQKLEQLIPPVS